MGANPTQALALVVFLAGAATLAGAIFGGGVVLTALGLVLLGASLALFLKAKPLEHIDG
jgi:hypothetical protein